MQSTMRERVRILLGGMGDDEFERFMSDLLPRIYPGFEGLEPSFNFMGKTTKGKCDAHAYHARDDTYTTIVCTTRQSNLRTKVLDDINKLTSTKFAPKIRRVLLCTNTPLKDEIEDYRNACKNHGWELESLSLEKITHYSLGEVDLLITYFGEASHSNDTTATLMRRFDCGERLKEARLDLSLSVSRLIEEVDFPSEREWNAIEAKHMEISERYIIAMTELTGISSNWLKHGAATKYPIELIYDNHSAKVESIASESPLRVYMAVVPDTMDLFLIVQFSELRWKVFPFGFSMDFDNWDGDKHHIPVIFKLLKTVNHLFNYPHGRVITRRVADELRSGEKHPSIIFMKTGSNNYWFDDLFDLNHSYPIAKDRYQHHGNWFVQLQNNFRRYINPIEVTSQRDPDDI